LRFGDENLHYFWALSGMCNASIGAYKMKEVFFRQAKQNRAKVRRIHLHQFLDANYLWLALCFQRLLFNIHLAE